MLYFKTITFMALVAVYTILVQDVHCRTVVANGAQRLALSNKRRISYNKRDVATAPAPASTLPNIQLPNADAATALLASAGPLLSSVSSVKLPQLPALPGAAAAAAAAPAPAAGYPAPAGYPPQYQPAAAPKAAKKDDEDED